MGVNGVDARKLHECQDCPDTDTTSFRLVGAAEFAKRLKSESGSIRTSARDVVKFFDAVGEVGAAEGGEVPRGANPEHANRRKEMQEQDALGSMKADRALEADEPFSAGVSDRIEPAGVIPP